jgi:ribosomal protein S10
MRMIRKLAFVFHSSKSISNNKSRKCLTKIQANSLSSQIKSNQQETASTQVGMNSQQQQQQRIKLRDYVDNINPSESKARFDYVTNSELKFYDPPYLEREALFPNYELLNINLKGYDYNVLDVFYKFVEKLCDSLKIEVVEAYAMPARKFKVKTYQPFSTNLDKEYELNTYHRIVRIKSLKSTLAPILFESIQLNLPEGVQLNISTPNKEEDEFRYVPAFELNELKQQLEEFSKKPKSEGQNTVAGSSSTPTNTTPAVQQKPK